MTYLADVNVWLAMTYVAHVHYPVATAWFDEVSADQAALCRMTQSGLLRLLSNPKVMGVDVLTAADAWTTYDKLRNDVRVTFATEPANIEPHWRDATRYHHTGPNFWTDAYLTAFAAAKDLTLVTFDRAFTRQRQARVRLLKS